MPTAAVDAPATIGAAAAVVAVLAVAMLVRATIGFGDALLAMPILTVLIGVRAAAPLVTALSLTVAAMIVRRAGRGVVTREAIRLLVGALPGVAVGVLLLRVLPEVVLETALGATVCVYGLWRVRTLSATDVSRPSAGAHTVSSSDGNRLLAPVAGFAAGAFGSATGAGGPPVVMYGVARGWSPPRFRTTLQVYFLCAGAFAMCGYLAAGLWTTASTRLYIAALPGVAAAVGVGTRLAARVSPARFARLVAFALVTLGAALLITTIR